MTPTPRLSRLATPRRKLLLPSATRRRREASRQKNGSRRLSAPPDGQRSQGGDGKYRPPSRRPCYLRPLPRPPRRGRSAMVEFLKSEEGQGLVEYALIIAVIAIAVIVSMIFFRDQLMNYFSNIGNNLT